MEKTKEEIAEEKLHLLSMTDLDVIRTMLRAEWGSTTCDPFRVKKELELLEKVMWEKKRDVFNV